MPNCPDDKVFEFECECTIVIDTTVLVKTSEDSTEAAVNAAENTDWKKHHDILSESMQVRGVTKVE